MAGGAGMMTTFTDWDIIRNLLLAGRWTVLLSLVAFTGGALVTLPLLLLRLTGGVHLHTLVCPDEETFLRIRKALAQAGILYEK